MSTFSITFTLFFSLSIPFIYTCLSYIVITLSLSLSFVNITTQVPPQSVTTLSSDTEGSSVGWANFTIPNRTRFSWPHTPPWTSQAVDEPCRSLSPAYGAFEIALSETAAGAPRLVCRQAVPQDPGANAWTHRKNSYPVALLPGGSNAANVNVSVLARFETGALNPTREVFLCGRTPIFAPAKCQPNGFSLGVCLTLSWTAGGTSVSNVGTVGLQWRLTEANNQYHQRKGGDCSEVTVLANGSIPQVRGGIDSHWFALGVQLSDGIVSASVDHKVVAKTSTTLLSGVVSLGTAWNMALFDNLVVAGHSQHTQTPSKSFLFDVLTGGTVQQGFDGWAGLVLNLTRFYIVLPCLTQPHSLTVPMNNLGLEVLKLSHTVVPPCIAQHRSCTVYIYIYIYTRLLLHLFFTMSLSTRGIFIVFIVHEVCRWS